MKDQKDQKGQLRIGFAMSTEVGLRTQYLNWRDCLSPELDILPEWIVIDHWKPGGLIERIPGVPRSFKARLRAYIQAREGLSKGPFDALFVAGFGAMKFGRRALTRQPYFFTTDVTPKQLQAFGALYNKLPSRFAAVEKRRRHSHSLYLQQAAALFPWSQWAADSLINDYGVDPHNVYVIPPGVNLKTWTFLPRPVDVAEVKILFVGGDFYRKGGDLLLDWAAETKLSNWSLHMATREKIAQSSSRIRVYNHLASNDPALIQLYRQADIFVLPTRGDCYSLASIEAMASGLPVILSRTGGTTDIVRDGVTGFLIDPEDRKALATRLELLLTQPEKRVKMGCTGRQEVELRYNATDNIRRTVEIMKQHMGRL